MPATQGDLFVWFAAASYDVVFDLGVSALKALAPYATLARETTGWSYRHSRDLTGFEDGTENPTLYDAPSIALIDGGPGEGGSVLLFQQWVHKSAEWTALSQETQEKVIGRTKPDSIEFDEESMPADSHVTRTKVHQNGEELKIFRRNVPYGDVSNHGTLFIGFSADQRRMHEMLEQMAGIGGPRDALTRFSTPLTGAYYFCPSVADSRRSRPRRTTAERAAALAVQDRTVRVQLGAVEARRAHGVERRAQLPGAQSHARDETRRPRLLLPLEHRRAGGGRHLQGRAGSLSRLHRMGSREPLLRSEVDARASGVEDGRRRLRSGDRASGHAKDMRANPQLAEMVLVRRGRLSVQPVTPREWKIVLAMSAG